MAVYFENISYEIRKILRSATKKIVICVAWIDFDIYYQELENALNRGVSVRILVTRSDKVKSNSLYISNLQQKGVVFEVIVLGRAINCMHNKIAIIDDAIVITGSYNWTHNAESNYENVFIDTNISVQGATNDIKKCFRYAEWKSQIFHSIFTYSLVALIDEIRPSVAFLLSSKLIFSQSSR